ncbi:unnamed protein product [Moneuplotes crassus]|uniref:Uncharacterized protein n=1 Tax=Euplotes crassus TaxID=5936 RepID=A0AAD1U968_EUPCR|nr:unnamed protein product [Moneuplotes crassus]
MSSPTNFPKLCDINDTSYLYPENVFSSIASAEPEDACSLFSLSMSSSESYPARICNNPDPLEQQASNEICGRSNLDDFSSYLRKTVNEGESEGTFVENPKSGPAIPPQEISIKNLTSSNRRDVAYKSAIRLLRKFYRDLFKAKNPDIVQKTYLKCTLEQVYERVHIMLAGLIPPESFTEDLIHYTIGMIGIKKAPELECCCDTKNQVIAFHRCARQFSRIKFENALESENLRALAWCLVQELDDPRVNIFIEELSSTLIE